MSQATLTQVKIIVYNLTYQTSSRLTLAQLSNMYHLGVKVEFSELSELDSESYCQFLSKRDSCVCFAYNEMIFLAVADDADFQLSDTYFSTLF